MYFILSHWPLKCFHWKPLLFPSAFPLGFSISTLSLLCSFHKWQHYRLICFFGLLFNSFRLFGVFFGVVFGVLVYFPCLPLFLRNKDFAKANDPCSSESEVHTSPDRPGRSPDWTNFLFWVDTAAEPSSSAARSKVQQQIARCCANRDWQQLSNSIRSATASGNIRNIQGHQDSSRSNTEQNCPP